MEHLFYMIPTMFAAKEHVVIWVLGLMGFELCPSSIIMKNTKEHNLETGFVFFSPLDEV
jgi:hypothetical protein